MGMAASQARYLALVARKSNCEYEGQQINQSRLNLSNQSANLFNQMLGLSVPVPPSTSDYTTTQYSFSDGVNAVTMDSWQQLATPEEDYNYAVTYHYNTNVYTGSQKKLNDPQVQFSSYIPDEDSYATQIALIQSTLKEVSDAQTDYDEKLATYKTKLAQASKLTTYVDNSSVTAVSSCEYNETDGTYTVKTNEGSNSNIYTSYDKLGDDVKTNVGSAIDKLKSDGALDADYDLSNVYYDTTNGVIAFKSDLVALKSDESSNGKTILPVYHINDGDNKPSDATWESINDMDSEIAQAKTLSDLAKIRLETAEASRDSLNIPSYVGNCSLTALSDLSTDQEAAIAQIIKDMQTQDVDSNFAKCFDTNDGTYNASTYTGGIYTFTMGGNTYYTTYQDLADTANSGSGINNIDGQAKLAYYNASYVSTNIEETKKALLETDGGGRFTSIRLEDDSVTYTLTTESVTDDAAYQDAMNEYYYESALYDKQIQDINAKTSIIQQEDQQLELRLKQLDTEQSALSTEIDAVAKVVKDNIEKSFKTFNS